MGGFIMLVKYIVVIVILLICASVCWLLHGILYSPVKPGENTKMSIILEVDGGSRDLEHTLRGLKWLRDNGTLKADIILSLNNPDENTEHIARTFSEDCHYISLRNSENRF